MLDVVEMTAWRLGTCHETSIEPHADLGYFVHALPHNSQTQAVLLRGSTAMGLMVGLDTDCDHDRRPLVKLVHVHDRGEGKVALSDPHTGLFWCAIPLCYSEDGMIFIDRLTPQSWEEFSMSSVEVAQLARAFPFLADYISLVDNNPIEDVMCQLMSRSKQHRLSDLDIDVLRHCTSGLPNGMDLVIERLELHPNVLDLARRLTGDQAEGEAIGRLQEWLDDRDNVAPEKVLTLEIDSYACMDLGSAPSSKLLVGALRSRVAPRKRACLVATARNEGPYILEWIAYHRAIGFDHIFIYSNDNEDNSDKLLSCLDSHGIITFISNRTEPSISSQTKAYSHALSALPHILDYEWALFCDLDEFFVIDPHRYRTLGDFLATQQASCNAIALNWLWFGNFGARDRTVDCHPYTHRFTLRHADVNPAIKTMCRPGYFRFAHPHYPFAIRGIEPAFQDCEGNPYRPQPEEFAFSTQPTAGAAGINHYVYKSIEDCLWKFCRNTGDRPLVAGRQAADIANETGARLKTFDMGRKVVVDDRIIHCVPDLPSAMRELRGLRGVDAAASRCEEVMRKRVLELRDELSALDPAEQTEFAQIAIGLLRGEDLYQRA